MVDRIFKPQQVGNAKGNTAVMDGKHLKLVEHLYQVAIDPFSFDNLLVEWEKTLEQALRHGTEASGFEALEGHASRASQILEKLDASSNGSTLPRLCDVIELDPNPAILLSRDGTVVGANEVARTYLGVRDGIHLADCSDIEFQSPVDWRTLIEKLQADASGFQGVLGLVAISSTTSRQSVLLAFSRAQCPSDKDVAGLLTALAPVWSKQTQQAVKEFFGLTTSEFEIVFQLMGGSDAAKIAETRETSLHTVRSQIKSILSKTGFSSQLDLVRQMGFLQRFEPISQRSSRSGALSTGGDGAASSRAVLQLRNGRKLDYVLAGPRDGSPVLFLHGMIDSNRFPQTLLEQLSRRSVLLIAPSRPSYGGSDPCVSEKTVLGDFATYACELLDDLGIGELPVFGHMAGTLYAVSLAARHPERVSSILSVAGAVPMVHRWQFDGMSKGHRIAGLTARHAPMLVPILTRGGIQLIRRGEQAKMMRLLYRDAAIDLEAAEKPEISELIFDRFEFVTRQGHQAFQSDLVQVSSDWSHLMEQVRCPLSIVHGVHDQAVLIEGVRQFAARHAQCDLNVSENSGQLILSNEPDLVLDRLEQLIREPEWRCEKRASS